MTDTEDVSYHPRVAPRPPDPEVSAAYGNALAAARKRRRLKQGQLERLSGQKGGAVGRLERGEREPALSMFLRLAEELGVDPHEMLDDVLRERRAARARQNPEPGEEG